MRLDKNFVLEHYSINEANKKSKGSNLVTAAMIGASALLAGNLAHNIMKNRVTTGETNTAQVTPTETPAETVNTKPVVAKPVVSKKETPAKVEAKPPEFAHDTIKKMVVKDEGFITKMYADTKGIKTVGVGHNLANTKQSKEIFNIAFGDNGSRVRNHALSGGKLSDDQVNKIFEADYNEHLERAHKLIPTLHEHPPEVQAALVSGVFRGHVTDSPKFLEHFNKGNYKEAAGEILNRKEYKEPARDAKGNIIAPGVIDRLERDHQIISDYAESKAK